MAKLNNRYITQELLGARSSTKTYLALDTLSHEQVIIKELSFGRLKNWKNFELFEREINTLKKLNHRSIPHFIEAFQIKTGEDTHYYLVTQYIKGVSLQEKLDKGWRPSEKDIREIAQQVLQLLNYIHTLEPPVIHRDIKPSNLILDSKEQVYLIDFGAVQDVLKPSGGSTVVGTFGYMPPEMFTGQSFANSDLYSLGTTLIHLLSGVNPAEMDRKGLNLNFQPLIPNSQDFGAWLEYMVKPDRMERFQSAQNAMDVLNSPATQVMPAEENTPTYIHSHNHLMKKDYEYSFSGFRSYPFFLFFMVASIVPFSMVLLIWLGTHHLGISEMGTFLSWLSAGALALGFYYGSIEGAARYVFSFNRDYLMVNKSLLGAINLNYHLQKHKSSFTNLKFTSDDELKRPLKIYLDEINQVRLKKNVYGYYSLHIADKQVAEAIPEAEAFFLQKKLLQHLVKHQKPENAKSSLLQLRCISKSNKPQN